MTKKRRISASAIGILLIAAIFLLGLPVHAEQSVAQYDPYTDGIVTSYYSVDREKGFVMGIAPDTTAQQLQKVCLPAQTEVSQEILATGVTLSAQVPASDPAQEPAVHTLTAIVTGDLNGDGTVTITDMLMLKSSILGNTLADTAMAAGDINYDGAVTITDFLRIKATLLGRDKITAGKKGQPEAADPLLLMTPGSTEIWKPTEEAVSFVSGDESLVSVTADGTITATEAEGTTFIYALDSEGQLLARTVVTVLAEKLAVNLDADSHNILAGKSQKLTVHFNHPLTPAVTWSSTDAEIASVAADGTVTAHKVGTAVVRAALENGSYAETTVTVIPPITGLDTGKALYKVKPGASRAIELELTPADVEETFTWTTSDPAIVQVSEDGTVTGVTYGTATVTATGKYSGLSVSCQVKVCDVKQIAITFDDGPSQYTPQLLDFLKENDIQITFFLVGNRLESFPEILQRQVDEGHEIGYHSYAHAEQTSLSSEKITSDFEKSEEILKRITGAEFAVWRTPYGSFNDRVLQCVDLPHIMWSVDSDDWKVQSTYKVYSNIVSRARDGRIVLIHDLYNFSVKGAIMAMEELIAGDYEIVTVTELLSRDGTPPEPGKTYYSG